MNKQVKIWESLKKDFPEIDTVSDNNQIWVHSSGRTETSRGITLWSRQVNTLKDYVKCRTTLLNVLVRSNHWKKHITLTGNVAFNVEKDGIDYTMIVQIGKMEIRNKVFKCNITENKQSYELSSWVCARN